MLLKIVNYNYHYQRIFINSSNLRVFPSRREIHSYQELEEAYYVLNYGQPEAGHSDTDAADGAG